MSLVKQVPFFIILILLLSCRQNNSPHTNENQNKSLSLKHSSGFAAVNGINMYYEIYGSGEPLVLIHGGGSTIQTSFAKIIPFLSEHYQLIAIETQAHGRSSDRDTAESFEQDADDVHALLKSLNIKKVAVVGFSNGGSTALQMAIRHPEAVDKLVAISPLCSRDGVQDGFWDFMKNGTFKDMPQLYKDEFLKVNNDTAKLKNMYWKDSQRMINFKDWDEQLIKSISCPVLLLGGDKDVIKPSHLVKLTALISDSRLCVVPGQHGEFIGEANYPKASEKIVRSTVAIIEEFLAQ